MTTMTISYHAKDVDEVAVGTQLYSRFLGKSGRASLILAFAGPLFGVAILVHIFTDLGMLRTEVLVLVYALSASIFSWIFISAYYSKRLRRLVDQATYRNAQVTWHFSPDECFQAPEYGLKWVDLTAVHHFKKMTVLDFAVRRAVIVPDSALPDDMTPADFAQYITGLAKA